MKNTVNPNTDTKQKSTVTAHSKTEKSKKVKPAIAYQNKDIASKTFTEMFPKSFPEVCGISLPEIIKVHSLNLPAISANELRLDTLFELADGSFAIVDYESSYREENKIKYLEYIVRIVKRLKNFNPVQFRVIVLYTADITPQGKRNTLNLGAVQLQIEQSFLSELDSEEIRQRLTSKIHQGKTLTEHELVEFVLLPLTYAGKAQKKEVIHELFELAKDIEHEKTQVFLLAGMMVFTDKVIDRSDADQIRR